MKKRILSQVLVIVMLLGIIWAMPVIVGATGEEVWDEWDGTSEASYTSEGLGTAADPYIIRTAEQWANLAVASVSTEGIPDGLHFVLEANLDFMHITDTAATPLKPISKDGRQLLIYFDGKGHTIKGVDMKNTSDGSGLFGDIWGDQNDETKEKVSVIKNLLLTDSTFESTSGWAGSVVGEVSGPIIIENVYVDKSVTVKHTGGKGKAGGILGGCYFNNTKKPDGVHVAAEYTVFINDCVFAGIVLSNGNDNGGIVGYVNSIHDGSYDEVIHIVINRCLVTGIITPTDSAKNSSFNGFVGWNSSTSTKPITGETKPSVTINDSIYAGGAQGEYYTEYPFGEAADGTFTVTNSFSVSAATVGENTAMYESSEGPSNSGVTLVTTGIDALIGLGAEVFLDGWTNREADIMVPTGVIDFAPVFISSVTVNWDINGEIVTETYAMGQMPSYKGETPVKADDETYTYTFLGWSPTVTVALGDVTYTATFTRKKIAVDTTVAETTVAVTTAPATEATTDKPETENKPETEKTSGCKKSATIISGLTILSILGSAVVIFKKH